uniref:Uncharacterized protein n=1 Tax=Rhizophora mucronata TaxID=61149 RepID=A0A2P2L7R6_RHIMU
MDRTSIKDSAPAPSWFSPKRLSLFVSSFHFLFLSSAILLGD